MHPPLVSIVVGSYNRLAFLQAALDSVRDNGVDFPYEIIVVDGGSTDGTLEYLIEQKDVITVIQHNRGEFRGRKIERRSWGYFMNLGFKAAQGKYVLMISDDSLLIPGAIKNGVDEFENGLSSGRNLGALAFYWRNWPEQNQYWVGITLGGKMFVNHGLYLRTALEKAGWIDEENYKFYHADGDLCLKLWHNGYEVAACSRSFVEHFTHANVEVRQENLISQQNDWKTYLNRWTDIYYDPKLDNAGGWLYMDYHDETNTSRLFPVAKNSWLFGVLRKIKKIFLKIASLYRQ